MSANVARALQCPFEDLAQSVRDLGTSIYCVISLFMSSSAYVGSLGRGDVADPNWRGRTASRISVAQPASAIRGPETPPPRF